jgi:hypothetical protein
MYMKILSILISVLLTLLISVNYAVATPVQYSENDHWYNAISGYITWDNAKTAAESSSYMGMQGHLATITSQGENKFIANSFPNDQQYWLGGFQKPGSSDPSKGWQWVTSEPWKFTSWASDKPNESGGDAHALQVWYPNNKWGDFPNNYGGYGYIVEYEPTT